MWSAAPLPSSDQEQGSGLPSPHPRPPLRTPPSPLQACTSLSSQAMDAYCWDAFAGSPPACSQDCLSLVGAIGGDCLAELLQWEWQLNQFLATWQGTQLWYW